MTGQDPPWLRPSWLDRALLVLFPSWGERRIATRARLAMRLREMHRQSAPPPVGTGRVRPAVWMAPLREPRVPSSFTAAYEDAMRQADRPAPRRRRP